MSKSGSQSSAGPQESRPRRRRWLRIALIICGAGLLLIVLAVLVLMLVFSDERVRRIAETTASEKLNRTVTIGKLDLDPFSGVRLTDLRIAGLEKFGGEDFARVETVDARIRVWPAIVSLGKRLHVRVSVDQPELRIVRGEDGEFNFPKLPKREKGEPPSELSLDVQVKAAKVTFIDRAGREPKRTVLSDIDLSARLPSYHDPLRYEISGNAGTGSFRLAGAPTLFQDRKVDLAKLEGQLLDATVTDFPVRLAEAPPALKTAGGNLVVTAHAGRVAAVGQVRADTTYRDVALTAELESSIDPVKKNVTATVDYRAASFANGELTVDVADAGREKLSAGLTFNGDLARLTGSAAASDMAMLTTASGEPATSEGKVRGKLSLGGSLTELTMTLDFRVTDFRPHPSLTSGTALPLEDVSVKGKVVIELTPEHAPKAVRIPNLTAKSSFLNANVSDGRIASLSDLRNFESDLQGDMTFSGATFSRKFGKALGLPPIHDKLEATFSAQGTAGAATVTADAKLLREEGPPEPVELSLSGKLDAGGEEINLGDLKLTFRGGPDNDRYADVALTGRVNDLRGARDLLTKYSARVDIRRLSQRLDAYSAALRRLQPAGSLSGDGKAEGTPRNLTANFQITAARLGLQGKTDKAAAIPDPVLEVVRDQEMVLTAKLAADVPAKRVDVNTLKIESQLLSASAKGRVTDYAAYKADLAFFLKAKTPRAGTLLKELGLLKQAIDTDGSAEIAGRIDTARGRLTLRTLGLDVPYARASLADETTITGIDIAAFRNDPVAAARALKGSLAIEGAARLAALSNLPKSLIPPKLAANGDVPFTVRVRQGSPLAIDVTADASGASITFGDLVSKAAGRRAQLTAACSLPQDGRIDISSVRAHVEGGDVEFVGALSSDFATVGVGRLILNVTDPVKLAQLSPRLTAQGTSGKASVNLSGTIPIKQVAAGKLEGIELTGAVTLKELRAVPAAIPDLQVTADGKATLAMDAVDAGGLTLNARNTKSGKGATLKLKTLRVTPVQKGVPLFRAIGALRLAFDVTADEIDAGALVAAMPKDKAGQKAKKPLDLSFLKSHVADGTIRVGRLRHPKIDVRNISTTLKLADNKLSTPTPATAAVYKGGVKAEMTADLNRPDIAHQGTVRLNQIDVNTAASSAANLKGVLRGKVGGTFKWSGTGFSKAKITSTWTGSGDLLVRDGAVVDLNGHPLAAKVFGPVATHLGAKAFPNNRYECGRLHLDLRLENGKVGLRDTRLTGVNDLDFVISRALVSLDKTIDARIGVQAPMELSMKLIREKVTTNKTALKVIEGKLRKNRPTLMSFEVSGSPAAPKVVHELTIVPWATGIVKDTLTDPGSLLKDLFRRGAEDLIEREQEESKEGGKDAADDEKKHKQKQEDDKDRPRRDAVRDLLEGLLN
ncbi:MAG: AsmA family protein [Planctomycetota bacterium]